MPPLTLRVLRSHLRNWLATVAVVAITALAVAQAWRHYVLAPWTRDGRVRVQVANVAPQVSGQIVELRAADNQTVRAGDVLYRIDPFDYRVAVEAAEAEVENREADVQVKTAQSARRQALTTVSTSVEEKQLFAGTARIADAALKTARARLAQARINLRRTEVRSPVDGYVTNLQLRVGDYATAGKVDVSVVDRHSFWVDGYFEETKLARLCVGDAARVELMGFDRPLIGQVESFGRGISVSNAAAGAQGLPGVDPVYTWVRLAQRVPVRVRLAEVPPGVLLAGGLTATVRVVEPSRTASNLGGGPADGVSRSWPAALADRATRALDGLRLSTHERRACARPDNAPDAPAMLLPYDEGGDLMAAASARGPQALPMTEAAPRSSTANGTAMTERLATARPRATDTARSIDARR